MMDGKCKRCGKERGYDLVDPCLKGFIPGVIHACCGHGDVDQCYIMFENRVRVGGKAAYQFLEEYKFQMEVTKRQLKDQKAQMQRLRKKVIESSYMNQRDKKAAMNDIKFWENMLGVDKE